MGQNSKFSLKLWDVFFKNIRNNQNITTHWGRVWIRNENYSEEKMLKNNDNSTNFLGFDIVSSSYSDVLKLLKNHIQSNTEILSVFTPNPEQIVFATSYKPYEKTLGFADLRIPDGVGLVLGSRFLSFFAKSEKIIERISGVDVVSDLLGWLHDQPEHLEKRILIVGGRGYSGKKHKGFLVSEVSCSQGKKPEVSFDESKTLFWYEGFLNVSVQTKDEQKAVQKVVSKVKPDIIFVAFGAPYQEEWVVSNYDFLKSTDVQLVMVVGGAFDMLLGKLPRAPKWMRQTGLEWLFRLYKEPWRWRRQLKLVKFVKLLVQKVVG